MPVIFAELSSIADGCNPTEGRKRLAPWAIPPAPLLRKHRSGAAGAP